MAALVNVDHVDRGHVRINLRGDDAGMAQKLLNGAQIRSAIEQVSCKAMPQSVRVNALQPGSERNPLYDAPDVRRTKGLVWLGTLHEIHGSRGSELFEGLLPRH
jgi:hypothetical protein